MTPWNADNQYVCDREGCDNILDPRTWKDIRWRGGYYCSTTCRDAAEAEVSEAEAEAEAEAAGG